MTGKFLLLGGAQSPPLSNFLLAAALRFHFHCLLMLGVILGSCLTKNSACGQWIEPADLVSPLVDNDPFDLLYLNKKGEDAILKILPLSKPLPNPFPERGLLIFDFASDNGERLQVPYSSIKSHKSFNEILIEEGNQWLREKKYALAFRNLLYVYDHGGKGDDEMVKSLRNCLFLDATENFKANRFELSLSIFEDIYNLTPDFQIPGIDSKLIDIILLCYDGIIQNDFDAGEFRKVRKKMDTVGEKFQKDAKPLVEKWTKAFAKRADELMEEARQRAAAGEGRLAHLASKQAEQINPGRVEIKQLQEKILKQFPLVVVGTSQPAADANGNRMEHWGARRVGRLTQRTLIELAGLGEEGGKYSFLNGTFKQADEIGLKYQFEIVPSPLTDATPQADAFLVSSRLLAAADPQSSLYNVGWEKILQDVEITDENKVVITLRTPFVRPEALLKFPYVVTDNRTASLDGPASVESTITTTGASPVAGVEGHSADRQNGVYILTDVNKDISTFELNPQYEFDTDRQHPVLIEQLYSAASTAVDELIKGNIDVVDRIPVADIARLKAEPGIVVRPYVIPTTHMLIPKIRGELKDDLYFRSGLSNAINREVLVKEAICDGQDVSGCEVLSGPFPVGTEENDQISYAYDLKIRPSSYNSKLAMVLIELSLRPTKKRPDKLAAPTLVLAHPDSSSATEASNAIAAMWNAVGVPTNTRKLKPDEAIPPDDQWDLLYVEAAIEEPLTDIAKIIGPDGFAPDVSAPVEQTMRLISYANSWRSACNSLRRLHRQLSNDLSVISLWQIKEHYAYRNTVTGIGRDLIHLYQNVDRWQIDTYGTDEKE